MILGDVGEFRVSKQVILLAQDWPVCNENVYNSEKEDNLEQLGA